MHRSGGWVIFCDSEERLSFKSFKTVGGCPTATHFFVYSDKKVSKKNAANDPPFDREKT